MPQSWSTITKDPDYSRLTSAQQATLLGEWQQAVEKEASRTLRPLKRDADLVTFWTELDAYGQDARQTIAAGAEKQDALVRQGPLSLAGKAKAAGEAFLEGSARVGTGILTGIGMLGRETQAGLEATAKAVGQELPPKQGEDLVEKAADLNERTAKAYERDPRAKGSMALDQLPQGAATLLGLFTPGAAAKVAGLPTKAAAAVSALTGASLEGAEQYHSAVAAGAPERVALKAWAAGMAIGSTDALPLARPLARVAEKLDKASGGAFRRMIVNAPVSAVEEAAQEWLQTSAGNAAAVALYEEAPDTFAGLAEGSGDAAAVGGILGAVLGAVTTQGRRAGRAQQDGTAAGTETQTLPMPAEDVEVLPPQALPGPDERIATAPAPSSANRVRMVPQLPGPTLGDGAATAAPTPGLPGPAPAPQIPALPGMVADPRALPAPPPPPAADAATPETGQTAAAAPSARMMRQREVIGDILDDIEQRGGMMSATEARRKRGSQWWGRNSSLYDDAPGAVRNPRHNFIYGDGGGGKGALTPDQMAQALVDAGRLPPGATEAEMWQAIRNASEARMGRGADAMYAEMEKQTRSFERNTEKPTRKRSLEVPAQEMSVGDKMEVAGEILTVSAIDPDTGDVTLDDGAKFGRQVIEDGRTLYVERADVALQQEGAADAEAYFDPWEDVADETTAPNAPETWGVPLGAVDPSHRVWERVGSAFRSRGDLPQSAFDIRLEAEGQQAAIEKQAEQNVRALEGALREVAGRGLTEQSRQQRAAALNAINQVMTGQAPISSLPAALQAPVRAARQHIDALSLDYVREGVAQGPLVQTILDGMGTYVNRAYEKFDNPRWRDQVDPGVVANAVGLIRRQTPRQAGESLADYERRVHGIVEALLVENTDSPVDSATRGALSRKDLSNLRRRRDIPPEIRALWGEYTNPIQNYARTVAKMGHTLAAHRNLTALRQDGLGEYIFEEPQPGFADRISAEGNAAMAPLDGLYTSREIRDALLKGQKWGNDVFPGFAAMMTFSAAAKYGKTVLSIVTQVRNFLSNAIYTVALGNVPTAGATTAMRAMVAELMPDGVLRLLSRAGYDRARWEAYVRRKVELGVLENSVGAQELRDVMRDSLVGDVDLATWSRNMAQRWAAKGARTASKFYAAGDGFWKVLNHEAEMRKFRAAFPNWSQDRLERHAARVVRDAMPSYGLIPDVAKGLRRIPFIAPFVSFTAEVVRNNANLVTLTRQEMANPATRAIGARRLAGLVAAHSLPIGAWMLSRYLTGTTDEEEDGIRSLSAPWDENAMMVHLGKGSDGQRRFINLSYIDPFSWLKNPLVALMRGDMETEQAQLEALLRMAEPFIGEDLAMGGLVDVLRNQTKDGRQIFNPTAPAREKWQRIAAHLWSKAEPGAIAQAERVYMGVTGKRTPYGRSYNAQDEMVALATGQRIVQLDPANALLFRGITFRKDETAAAQNLTSVIGRRGTVTDDQIANAWEVARISREKVWQKAIAATNGALELGQSPQAVYSTLRAAGVPKMDAAGMMSGQEIPWTMTPQQIEKAAGIPGRLPQLLRVLPREAWDLEALKKTLRRPAVRQQLQQAAAGAGAG